MNELKVKEYLGKQIEFKVIDGEVYVNATSFDEAQKLKNWKRSPKTQELIDALQTNENADVQNLHFAELIISDKGGNGAGGGTWIEENFIVKIS